MYGTLLILEVVLPLLVALLLVFSDNRVYKRTLLFVAQAFGVVASVILFIHISGGAKVSLSVGGWDPKYGIEVTADICTAIMLLLLNAVTSTTTLYSLQKERDSTFYTILMLCHTGFAGMVISNDLFNIYVFLELSSLASYTLVATKRTHASYKASFEYLILGTIAATLYLIGVGLIYAITGHLNIGVITSMSDTILNSRIGRAGITLIILGIITKCALFPLHFWLVRCYNSTSTTVAAFFSGTSSKVGLYLLAKFIYCIFGRQNLTLSTVPLDTIIFLLSTLAILICGLQAVVAQNVRQTLVYSSVSQIGYISLTLSLTSDYSVQVAMLQMLAHATSKSTLFMLLGNVTRFDEGRRQDSSGSKFYLLVATLSLAGIPITAGFLGKLELLILSIQTDSYMTLLILLVGSIITVLYSWKIFNSLKNQEVNNSLLHHIPLLTLSLMNIIIPFTGSFFLELF